MGMGGNLSHLGGELLDYRGHGLLSGIYTVSGAPVALFGLDKVGLQGGASSLCEAEQVTTLSFCCL